MTSFHHARVLGFALIAAGATACTSAPEALPPAPRTAAVDALLPADAGELEHAVCISEHIRDANERYANRRARARGAAYRRSVHAATLAETTTRAAAQASVTALDQAQHAAENPGHAAAAMRADWRAVRAAGAAMRAASGRTTADAPEPSAEVAPDEMARAAARAASAVRGSLSAANRFARLSSLHAEAFAAALAAERGDAPIAEAGIAAGRVSRAVADWPDGEALYRTNFAAVSRAAPARCER